jgi:hypothetical protein
MGYSEHSGSYWRRGPDAKGALLVYAGDILIDTAATLYVADRLFDAVQMSESNEDAHGNKESNGRTRTEHGEHACQRKLEKVTSIERLEMPIVL